MGNDSSQIEKFTDAVLANFDNFISIEGQEVQGIFGKCTLYQKKGKQNEYVICKKISIGNEQKQKQMQSYFEQRMQLQHPSQLKFYGYSFNKQNSFCSTNYSFNVYYEYHPISLLQENNNRQHNEEIYQLNELWYMAKSLIGLCNYLQQNDEVHPNIHPSTIFLTEAGQLKLVDSSILTLSNLGQKVHHISTDHQTQALNYEQRYIAPEEVVNLKNMNKYKLSIFQVGMTLLESALIQDCSYIYLEDDSINQNSLDFLVNKVQEIYGDSFTTFLKKILQLNPNNRPDSFEINQSVFKSLDFGSQSQLSQNRLSEVQGVGEASPAPRSMRLNSSLINQGVVLNPSLQNGSNTHINSNNPNSSSRVSTSTNNFTSRNNQHQMLMNQQNNQNSDLNRQNNKETSYQDIELIKTPVSQQLKAVQSNNLFSQQISLQNSPTNRENKINSSLIHQQEFRLNSSTNINKNNNNSNNINNGPFLHNFQSFSNTMNNQQPENTGMNSSTGSIGYSMNQQRLNNNTFSVNQPQNQMNQYDQKSHQQVKYVESQLKSSYYSQTPPKIRPMQEGSLTVLQQQQINQNNNQTPNTSNQSTIYIISNPYGKQSNISQAQLSYVSENKGNSQNVDNKLNSNLMNYNSNVPLKESNNSQISQQYNLSSGITNPSEIKQGSSKYSYENPTTNASTVYKVFYSRSSSPQNQPKPLDIQQVNIAGDTNKFQMQNTNKIPSVLHNSQIQFTDTQKKIGNYYSSSNNNSFSQNQSFGKSSAINSQPVVVQAQRKFGGQQDHQQQSSLERNGTDNQNQQKKQTTIKSTQIVNPKLIASNLAPK